MMLAVLWRLRDGGLWPHPPGVAGAIDRLPQSHPVIITCQNRVHVAQRAYILHFRGSDSCRRNSQFTGFLGLWGT